MSISVGDTFEHNGFKWAVKLVDLDGKHPNNKAGTPRIDASKFYNDEFGLERVRKGRPSKFKPDVVFNAMGLPMPELAEGSALSTETIPIDDVELEWEQTRVSEARIAELIGSLDDDSDPSDSDW